ncbi:protein EARLY FLOWERING 3-like [Neltuma alba]|uniref:protein EARLY FLOWERING 3-like n=1 Tax=Neltuma alba TaxID=207710 RepID=UPI0010A3B62E|nr:protein EARLY FLOWERING 3-like [Prosopis alba]XP_028806987.1 protein EARLY FLOWERING 3-like [Prosopis alba]
MKRGKDDEKFTGPMFPRLHVNDTEKGGPRAPPRNKMALYELLSIPSQRFNAHGDGNTVPPASSSQGTCPDRSHAFPVHLPPQTPTYRARKNISHQSDGANLNTSFAQFEQRKEADEDDFRVPVYVHLRSVNSNDKTQKSFSGNEITPMGSRHFASSVDVQNNCDKDLKKIGSPHVNVRRDLRSTDHEGLPKVSPSRDQAKSVRSTSKGENNDSLVKQAKSTPNQDCPLASLSRLHRGDACIQPECGAESKSNDSGHGEGLVESARDTETGSVPLPRGCFHSTADKNGPMEASNNIEYHDTTTGGPLQNGHIERSESFSKTSMVDDLSSMKISPDDVVEIIGQKRFWKARRAIVYQQRVFAVQVFELHRLIKVQKLIAGSPDLLLEDGAFLGKSPPKGSAPKKLSLEYVLKPQQQSLKGKDDSVKLNHKLECSAENAVGKTSVSSVKNGSHLSNYTPFSGNPHQANVTPDSKMGPWYFHQSPGRQWLIPVMSPTEGLVYKPYPGPGFGGVACQGFGPFGPTPSGGDFMNPVYGVPASNHGIGVPPDAPLSSYAYCPPYGMPVMNPTMSRSAAEQMNLFAAPGSNGHLSGEGADFNTHNNQGSYNFPVQRNESMSNVMKIQAPKGSEFQRSTASSPGGLAQGISTGQNSEGIDALSPFPMAPVVAEGAPQSLETRQQTRVIKVVPHNPRSATESAVRIFRSIQEERKQYDSV